MRLTVNLEDDLYAIAHSLAKAEDTSVSAAVNKLLRRAFEPRAAAPATRKGKRKMRNSDYLSPSKGARPFTSEDVYRIEEMYS